MDGPRELHYRWSWSLPAEAEALWPLVSDTNRFNRDTGLPPVEDLRAPGEELRNARHRLGIRVLGVPVEWEELPFEWMRPWRFGVVRRYSRGPLREMRVRARLEPEGRGRTRLTYDVVARPRGLLGLMATPLQIGLVSRIRFGRTFRRYARVAALAADAPETRPQAPDRARRRPGLEERLEAEGVEPVLARRLVDHVVTADDMSLARMRPYVLADLWGLRRRDTLGGFLRATRGGLLDMRWDILCPVCRGPADGAATLRELHTGMAHCDTCLIEFSPTFDQSVEVTFSPAPAVRRVQAPPFCVAGPQITPHVEVQQLLGPGEGRTVTALLVEGRHRARAFGLAGGPSFLVEAGGTDEQELRAGASGWALVDGPVTPTATLHLVNDTDEERLFVVERTSWGDTAATAAEVTALGEFRDLFASEILAVGAQASVGNLAVLFTDLKDSTRMYRRVGDAAAFGRVVDHFEVLEDAVRSEDGAVVKTIGDAVMAVFRSSDAAVRAVHRAQRRLADPPSGSHPLVLKAGVHYGPCISVTLNDRLDYFGTTVNVAARLGSLSGGNDVVVSDAVRRSPDVDEVLAATGAHLVSSEADIRGLDERLTVWRVTFPAS